MQLTVLKYYLSFLFFSKLMDYIDYKHQVFSSVLYVSKTNVKKIYVSKIIIQTLRMQMFWA